MKRISAITFTLILALAGVATANDTVSTLTANNTSASPTNLLPSKDASMNVSGVDIHDFIGTKITTYAMLKVWFGEVGHADAGYISNDVGQVHAQITDMQRRGLSGVILDWTASSALEEGSVHSILAEVERSGERFPVAIMEDLSRRCCATGLPTLTQTVIEDLNHANNNFYSSPAYMRVNGRPVVFVSGAAVAKLDWQAISTSVSGNPLFFFGDETTASTQSRVYTKLDRNFNRGCGTDWVNLLQSLGTYGLRNATPVTILLPWNDYEKREAIEPGIDSCVTVSAEVAANQLSWRVTGNHSSIDHYSLFRSSDGLNLVKFADVASDQSSVQLGDYDIPAGSFDLYVLATGKPSMKNHLSAAVHYEAQQPAVVVGAMNSLTPVSIQSSGLDLHSSASKSTSTGSTGTNAVQIQGRAVAGVQPQDSQYLGWNSSASQWQPLSISGNTTNLSSPGPIGGTTPSTMNATAVTAQSVNTGVINGVTYADSCGRSVTSTWCAGTGTDLGKWINAAIANTTSPVIQVQSGGTISTAVAIPTGRTVQFGGFSYTLSAPITIANGAGLTGQGRGLTKITVGAALTNSISTSAAYPNAVTISGFTLSNSGKATNGVVIGSSANMSSGIYLDHVESNDAVSSNFLLYNPTAINVHDLISGSSGMGPGGAYTKYCMNINGLTATGSGNSFFSGMFLYECNTVLYEYQGSNNIFTDNYLYQQNNTAGSIAIMEFQDAFENTITNNRIESLVTSAVADVLIVQDTGATFPYLSSGNRIFQNDFIGLNTVHPAVQIGSSSLPTSVYRTRIEGNRILRRSGTGKDINLPYAYQSQIFANSETVTYGAESSVYATVNTGKDTAVVIVQYDGSGSNMSSYAIAGNIILPPTLTGYHGAVGSKVQLSDGTGTNSTGIGFAPDGSITAISAFSGTRRVGGCTFTIVNGLITAITGC